MSAADPNPNTHVGRILPTTVYRFRRSERLMHWALALPYLACVVTGVTLFAIYNQFPSIGGRGLVSGLHRVGGVCLMVLPVLAVLVEWKDWKTHVANIKDAWHWDLDEVKWLFLMPMSKVKNVRLPEEGKFNAPEKLNFMSSMGTTVVMAVSGTVLWVSPTAVGVWFVHLAMAAMVLPLLGGHIFMATLNPATRVGLSGMLNGWVSRTWASHHYRRWYKQLIGRHLMHHGEVPDLDDAEANTTA